MERERMKYVQAPHIDKYVFFMPERIGLKS